MRTDYNVKIAESSRELTAREKVKLKDTTECIKLENETETGDVVIAVGGYAVLEIHNERSENKDYRVYVIFDKSGNKYITGSQSFFDSFSDIYEDMEEYEEEYEIKVYRRESKNRQGKHFLTCSLV